jgi:hypothetical protein
VCRNTLWTSRGMAVFPVGGDDKTQGLTLTKQVLYHRYNTHTHTHTHTPCCQGMRVAGVSDVSVGISEIARNHFVCFRAMSTK